jgi:hypothetical protein
MIFDFDYDKIMGKVTYIHCSNEEEARALFSWANSKGLKKHNGQCWSIEDYKEEICFCFKWGIWALVDDYLKILGYNILEFKDVTVHGLDYDRIMQPYTVVHCSTMKEVEILTRWANYKLIDPCYYINDSVQVENKCSNHMEGGIDCARYFVQAGYTILEFKDVMIRVPAVKEVLPTAEEAASAGSEYYKDLTLIDLKTRADQYQQFKKTGMLPDCELRTDVQRLQDSTPCGYFHISMLRTVLSLYETIAERFI